MTYAETQDLRSNGTKEEQRQHAWAILDSLVGNQTNNFEASWDSEAHPWENKCSLGLFGDQDICKRPDPISPTDCRLPVPTTASLVGPGWEVTRQQKTFSASLKEKDRFKQGTEFLSSVRYNQAAASFIRENCLYTLEDSSKTKGVLHLSAADPVDTKAVIVKLIWAIADHANMIHVWDPLRADELTGQGSTSVYPIVKVDFTLTKSCPADTYPGFKSYDEGKPSVPGSTVPIACFYHRSYPCEALNRVDPITVGQAYSCAPGNNFEAILMGAHIITAEQKDWVWTTFWWTPAPAVDPGYKNSPPSMQKRGPWRFFAMNQTMSLTNSKGIHNIAYSPYIEGSGQYSTKSNCMYCHGMAALPPQNSTITAGQVIGSGMPPPCVYNLQPGHKCDTSGLLLPTDPFFSRATGTHQLWSLVDNLAPDRKPDPEPKNRKHK